MAKRTYKPRQHAGKPRRTSTPASAQDMLDAYKRKRDFARTEEPTGTHEVSGGTPHEPVFVVQKHAARRLHYDLRLEVEGVLVSWAVPKGPSLNPKDKRLAMRTEDHPLEYAIFEGIIPPGEYGAGTVLVWDGGVYENLKHDSKGRPVPMEQCLEDGHVTVLLRGRKLRGAFALTRTGAAPRESWILVKMRDALADEQLDVTAQDRSILTDKTIEQIAEGRPAQWTSGKIA